MGLLSSTSSIFGGLMKGYRSKWCCGKIRNSAVVFLPFQETHLRDLTRDRQTTDGRRQTTDEATETEGSHDRLSVRA